MPSLLHMRITSKVFFGLCILLLGVTMDLQAQRRKKDSVSIYKDFIAIGAWYQKLPLQIKVRLHTELIPAAAGSESVESELTLFYGEKDFYMKVEGMEQIGNDSMVLLVNEKAKMMKLYPFETRWLESMQRTTRLFASDSSLQSLVDHYSAESKLQQEGIVQITLRSKDKLGAGDFPKELIVVRYEKSSHQPVSFNQSKFTLVPIDAENFNVLKQIEELKDRLVAVKKKEKESFFLVKEQRVKADFLELSHQQLEPPVRQQDRIVRLSDGRFVPTRSYQDYVISRE